MRALVLVLDSVGVGQAPDAAEYGDAGADTLGHILAAVPDLALPNLCSLGLRVISDSAGGARLCRAGGGAHPGSTESRPTEEVHASFGKMRERSAGKDTTTGHWEIAGVVLEEPFAVFERFPDDLVRELESGAGVHFIGNCARSGTVILEELGAEHLRSGNPILYTSADSVLQIAAHEEILPVARLLEICQHARRVADRYRIGRVIARPFLGKLGNFRRTSNRHDFSLRPPRTVLDALGEHGVAVTGVGKISDIFAGCGIAESFPTTSNRDGMGRIDELWQDRQDGLLFANLVDFDMLYGHRRDVAGYANALREFDDWLGTFLPRVLPNDLVIITADHGNDPTFRGTDHTREEVPLFVLHRNESRDLGIRETFADVAATLAKYFGLREAWAVGEPFF